MLVLGSVCFLIDQDRVPVVCGYFHAKKTTGTRRAVKSNRSNAAPLVKDATLQAECHGAFLEIYGACFGQCVFLDRPGSGSCGYFHVKKLPQEPGVL